MRQQVRDDFKAISICLLKNWNDDRRFYGIFMVTSSNGNISALLAICEGNPPVTGEFPSQRPVTRSYEVFFDPRLNERLSKQSRRRWFETPSPSLWCHCNVYKTLKRWWNIILPVLFIVSWQAVSDISALPYMIHAGPDLIQVRCSLHGVGALSRYLSLIWVPAYALRMEAADRGLSL